MPSTEIPAYILSNEPLRWLTNLTPYAQNVLTVAASGDQALFYKLVGATHIDTFDRTSCARVIQDIKTAAIPNMTRTKYIHLLQQVYRANLQTVRALDPIRIKLPSETKSIINDAINPSMIIQLGATPRAYSENIPQKSEYEKLQKILTQPFNFIESDIRSLDNKISQKYDVINISNIFDYMPDNADIEKCLESLTDMLIPGGYIVTQPQLYSLLSRYEYIVAKNNKLNTKLRCINKYDKLDPDPSKIHLSIMFQRIR